MANRDRLKSEELEWIAGGSELDSEQDVYCSTAADIEQSDYCQRMKKEVQSIKKSGKTVDYAAGMIIASAPLEGWKCSDTAIRDFVRKYW